MMHRRQFLERPQQCQPSTTSRVRFRAEYSYLKEFVNRPNMHYAAAAKSTKNGQSTNRDTKNYLTMTKYIIFVPEQPWRCSDARSGIISRIQVRSPAPRFLRCVRCGCQFRILISHLQLQAPASQHGRGRHQHARKAHGVFVLAEFTVLVRI